MGTRERFEWVVYHGAGRFTVETWDGEEIPVVVLGEDGNEAMQGVEAMFPDLKDYRVVRRTNRD